jgi:hypothetical protein
VFGDAGRSDRGDIVTVPVPLEWRHGVDQEVAQIRDVLDKRPEIMGELREDTELSRMLADWGMAIAANICGNGRGCVQRALAWMETLEALR